MVHKLRLRQGGPPQLPTRTAVSCSVTLGCAGCCAHAGRNLCLLLVRPGSERNAGHTLCLPLLCLGSAAVAELLCPGLPATPRFGARPPLLQGKQLEENPRASIAFWWEPLQRQVGTPLHGPPAPACPA